MRKTYAFSVVCILILSVAGCENYDKAIQGIEKGKEFVDNAQKKAMETREGAEKSIGKLLGRNIGKSNQEKQNNNEDLDGKKKARD